MKRTSLFILFVIFSISSFACSICGCGGSNIYFGLLPDFDQRFISLRYHHSQFHTQLAGDPSQFSTNYYNSVEVLGGFTLSPRIKTLVFVPFHFNKQVDDDGKTTKNGVGDISLIGQYLLLRSKPGNRVQQQLWVGGGIKAPTGVFNTDPHDSTTTIADINAQLGTGSIDYLLNASYTLSIGSAGINTSAAYKINSRNKDDYKYGNKFNANCIAFYQVPVGRQILSPNIGIGYESIARNVLEGSKVQYTGSHVTTALAGVEYTMRKIGFGLNAQLPVEQNFAEGQTRLQWKMMAHVTFSL